MRKILGRMSVYELRISKVLDFQLVTLLENGLYHRLIEGFAELPGRHFEVTPLSGWFWCFHTAILMQNSRWNRYLPGLLVSVIYLTIFLIPYKTQQKPTIIWAFWTYTCKNLKFVSVKFIGKIRCTLVAADLAYVILHNLKPICRTLKLLVAIKTKKLRHILKNVQK